MLIEFSGLVIMNGGAIATTIMIHTVTTVMMLFSKPFIKQVHMVITAGIAQTHGKISMFMILRNSIHTTKMTTIHTTITITTHIVHTIMAHTNTRNITELMYIKVHGSHTIIIFMTLMVIIVICKITTIMNGLKMEAILGIIQILATSTIQLAMKFGTTN
jgi:hypothetical protein